MAYVKTVWETGDVITADKLNNMEGGIEAHDPIIVSGVYAAQEAGYTVTFAISGPEMWEAYSAGKRILLHFPENTAAGLNETLSEILFVKRESDGDGGYYYGASDYYTITQLFGSGSFTDGAAAYVVSVGGGE